MPNIIAIFICIGMSLALFRVLTRLRQAQRAKFVRHYRFPKGLIEKLLRHRPGLTPKDGQLVAQALRQFFLAYLASGRQFVSMPSQLTDDLWHEFILYTRHYEIFCKQAFGRFMHHTPAVVLGQEKRDNTGLRRTWWHCCKNENINPKAPTRLPLLFAIDTKIGIADGFKYTLDCKALLRREDSSTAIYCAGDLASQSFDGGTDGFGDGDSSDGCGGDGCSGGCGGGD